MLECSSGLQLYSKETPTQVFSCEICEIFKNIYLAEHLWTTGSITSIPADIDKFDEKQEKKTKTKKQEESLILQCSCNN